MPKATLAEAVKSAAAAAKAAADAKAKTAAASAKAAAAAKATAAETEADGAEKTDAATDADDSDADGDEQPAADDADSGDEKPAATKSAPARKSLADFRAAFGHVEGSVFFADGVSFSDAQATHSAAQAKQIDDLKAANAALTATIAPLAKMVHGEEEPVLTGDGSKKNSASASALGSDALADFASGMKMPSKA